MYYGKVQLFPAARFSDWETEKFWARGLAFLAQKARQEQGEQGNFGKGMATAFGRALKESTEAINR